MINSQSDLGSTTINVSTKFEINLLSSLSRNAWKREKCDRQADRQLCCRGLITIKMDEYSLLGFYSCKLRVACMPHMVNEHLPRTCFSRYPALIGQGLVGSSRAHSLGQTIMNSRLTFSRTVWSCPNFEPNWLKRHVLSSLLYLKVSN